MAKTITQLTETTTLNGYDFLHLVDVDNNQDKKIKPVSLWNGKPYGECYTAAGGVTTIAIVSTYYNITNGAAIVTADGLLNFFTHDSATGTLTYTGEDDITLDVSAVVSLLAATTLSNIRVAIALNGAVVTKSIVAGVADPVIYYGNYNPTCILSLSKNDILQIFISNETGTDNLTVLTLNLQAKAL